CPAPANFFSNGRLLTAARGRRPRVLPYDGCFLFYCSIMCISWIFRKVAVRRRVSTLRLVSTTKVPSLCPLLCRCYMPTLIVQDVNLIPSADLPVSDIVLTCRHPNNTHSGHYSSTFYYYLHTS